jgi:hypothetical protein
MTLVLLLRIARLIAGSLRERTISDRAFNIGAVIVILTHLIAWDAVSLPRTLLELLGFSLAIVGLKWLEYYFFDNRTGFAAHTIPETRRARDSFK